MQPCIDDGENGVEQDDHQFDGSGAAHCIFTASPVIEPGGFDPLTSRLEVISGDEAEVLVPAAERLPAAKPPPRLREQLRDQDDISGLIRIVENAVAGNRNAALYWAACRLGEQDRCDDQTAALLEAAAVRAGLSQSEAAATVRSGLRHG